MKRNVAGIYKWATRFPFQCDLRFAPVAFPLQSGLVHQLQGVSKTKQIKYNNFIARNSIFALVLLLCSSALAQTNLIFIDYDTNKPIQNVTIFSNDKQFYATSNNEGKLTIPKLDSNVKLTVQHLSYYSENYTYETIEKKNTLRLIKKSIELEEFVVAVSKKEERLSQVSNKVSILPAKALTLSNPQTSADFLTETGNVFIQKSQMGGGSPIIRGFEANKVLIVVDGVKLNNAIYRGGHLQNVITIDPSVLSSTEVVYGPGSLIYGSDAIGGVMHFITKQPKFSNNEKILFGTNALLRTASANQEKATHLDFNIGSKKWASLTSISYSDFGNLKIGNNRKDFEGNWGQLPYIVSIDENGEDVELQNENENILQPTAYHQWDVLQKLRFKINQQHNLNLNLQYSTSSEIPRFDRMNDVTTIGNNTFSQPKWAKWNYGPQNRFLAAFNHNYISNDNVFANTINTTLSFQKIDEDRIKRKFGGTQTNFNEEDVKVYSFTSDLSKTINSKNSLQYGLELSHNAVASNAYLLKNNEVLEDYLLTRYPDEGSSMSMAAVYAKHKYNIDDKFTFTDGFRFTYTNLTANFSENVNDMPEKNFTGKFGAVTGAIGVNYALTENTRLFSNLGTGFRAPNIDDSAKFFDPQNGIVVIPNLQLKPEYTLNADIGVKHTISDKAVIKIDAFYNYLFNAIVRRPAMLNGLDSLVFDGQLSKIFSNQNAGRAKVLGISTSLNVNFIKSLSGYLHHNFVKGVDITENVPLGHIPPQFGETGLHYKHSKFETKLYLRYNAVKPENLYSPFGEDKESEALNELYTPAWQTLNLKFNTSINKNITISGGIENIFDKHYKPFASGISGPGRNFILAIRSNFSNY